MGGYLTKELHLLVMNNVKEFVTELKFYKKENVTADVYLPKISVVTPSLNHGKYLERSIISVLNQKYANLEYILIDGRSGDNTPEIIKRYEKYFSYWISEHDTGPWEALNKGFRRASGEIVAWLNADDVFMPNAFSEFLEKYRQNRNGDIFYGDYYFIDEEDNILKRRLEIEYSHNLLLYIGCYIPTSGTFFNKTIFNEGFYIGTGFRIAFDYEFLLRLSEAGKKFLHIKRFLSGFRRHGSNISLNREEANKEEERVKSVYLPRIFKNYTVDSRFHFFLRNFYLLKRGVNKMMRGGYFRGRK